MKTPNKEPSNCPKCGANMKTGYGCGEYRILRIGVQGWSLCGYRKMQDGYEKVFLGGNRDVLEDGGNCK